MATDSRQHNALWRQIRRRYPMRGAEIGLAIVFALAKYGSIATWFVWMWRGTVLAECARWLWCIETIFLLSIALLVGTFLRYTPQFVVLPANRWRGSWGFAQFLALGAGNAIVAIMLIIGHVDWAIMVAYSADALDNIYTGVQQRTWRSLLATLPAAFLIAAVLQQAWWLAMIGVAMECVVKPVSKPGFWEAAAKKPTKAEMVRYLDKERSRAGYMPYTATYDVNFLRKLWDLELWEEAHREFRSLCRAGQLNAQDKLVWQAKINVELSHDKEVVRLAQPVFGKEQYRLGPSLAKAYAQQGRYDIALHVAREAIDHGNTEAKRALGDVYATMQDYESALIWYERALQSRRDSGTWSAMGKALQALNDDREARAMFKCAVLWEQYLRTEDLADFAECSRRLGDNWAAVEADRLAQHSGAHS